MSNFSFPHFFLFSSIALASVSALEILQIAPNFLETNFELNEQFAGTLAFDGHHVHFLVPMSGPKQAPMLNHKNIHTQHCRLSAETREFLKSPPPDSRFINPPPEQVQIGGWSKRHFKQSPAVAFVEGYEVIADIYRNKECWNEISGKHFDVGIMDVWDFGALALFHKLGIKNVVLLHNMPLMSHMYDWMGEAEWPTESGEVLDYKRQILENGVPELFASKINDAKIGMGGAFAKEHQESVNIFTKVYEIADDKFKELFNHSGHKADDDKMPPLKELFGRAKLLFINTIPSLDYSLGKLPKQVNFVGGIDLMAPYSADLEYAMEPILAQAKHVILFSMGALVEPAKMPDDKFETVVKGLGIVGKEIDGTLVIWKYAKKECASQTKRDKFIAEHAPNVHLVNDFNPKLFAHEKTAMVISACDIRGAMDALKAEKPLLCMPMFAEHFYVAEKLRMAGAAVVIEPQNNNANFITEAFAESIRKCINLPKQANNPWESNVFKFKTKTQLENLVKHAFKEIEN